ncbi:nuclear transport factor 2 family protein [Amycolatopsis thermophila]|uniref:Uncharacterized protein (TIGR02246 family) n=1 Tax=Amycolatopsis thermophila TaxID=206084 RepID=A0ABU0F5U1_9PSEU|nr:nuclear transport factor 2 family protein [Amycolatopsis thermophila]MDQ0382748.1 uncharacterized protein (TIGR02246 family) [Amycolatopsis thermophila]
MADELRMLVDKDEIRELSARYNRAADNQRLEDFLGTFTPEGVFEVADGPKAEGTEAIRKLMGKAVYGSVHMTLDSVIEVDGDTATQTATLLMGHRRDDRASSTVVTTGLYQDKLVRTPDGWRFTHRLVSTDLTFRRVNKTFIALTKAEISDV